MVRLALIACVIVSACSREEAKPAPPPPPAPAIVAPPKPCPTPAGDGPIFWHENEYDAALTCARRGHVPLVVDLWAPWCHTCLSMQQTVFKDPGLAAYRDRMVFVSLDTDRDANAPALAKLAISAWPTFYVLGPDEAVLARFVGSSSVQQFKDFLDAGARAMAGGQSLAESLLQSGDRALAQKDYAAADKELAQALGAAPADWSRRPDVLGSLILTKYKHGDLTGCVALAEQAMDQTGNAAVASDFLGTATSCAEGLASDPARVKALRERAVARWQALLADAKAPLSLDDRTDAMASLRGTLDQIGRGDEAKRIAEQELATLDAAAVKAKAPLEAMTYNWPRAEVYVYLKRPLDLVPALEQNARDLPKQYDPRARLGWVLWKAGKLPEAAKATDDALAMVYGPRKGRLLVQRADIAAAARDKATERRFREAAVAQYEALPEGQKQPDALDKAKAALAALDGGGASAQPSPH